MELLYYVSSYIFNLIHYYQFSVSEDISHENDNTQNNLKLSVCKNNNLHVNNNATDILKLIVPKQIILMRLMQIKIVII